MYAYFRTCKEPCLTLPVEREAAAMLLQVPEFVISRDLPYRGRKDRDVKDAAHKAMMLRLILAWMPDFEAVCVQQQADADEQERVRNAFYAAHDKSVGQDMYGSNIE